MIFVIIFIEIIPNSPAIPFSEENNGCSEAFLLFSLRNHAFTFMLSLASAPGPRFPDRQGYDWGGKAERCS
ncbi:hypothetical protein J2129_002365 [Methanofollis sp. W23]|nr:hypothetical protein [Methanofollis sp. W23]